MEWMEHGACKYEDQELFFPEVGVSKKNMRLARAICKACVVYERCKRYGVYEAEPEDPAIYGGLTIRQRRDVRMGRRDIEQ